MDLIPYNPPEDRGPVYSHFERMVLNQLHELNVSQHEHHNYCNERFNALDGQIHDIHDMLHSFQTRNDPQDDWVWWLFRIMHCILVFVIFQFEFCQFQLVVFLFQSADCISFMHLFSVFSFCWLYFLPILIKWYAMLVIFMHLFCLMNPKREKNWTIGKWIIDHIKLSIKNWNQ